jgi:serine protease Do
MNRKDLLSGAAGAAAATILLLGGQLALAQEPHSVNPRPVAPPATAAPASFADIVARVAPAVVSVDVESKATAQSTALPRGFPGQPFGPFGDLRRFFPQVPQNAHPRPVRGTGSGFFISADGYIVTNNHVVDHADDITVRTADGRTLKAQLIGADPATDLAVIKVQGSDFPFVNFEDRAKPRVGDWVVAVGNPFNLGGTATAGIVSALSRPNVSGSSYVDYMQIDAPINRGNSGGPTFDLYGRVVGVNSAIFSPSGGSVGIGFDIPADVASRVAHELIAKGKVTRGYIGATVQDVTPEIAESLGVETHAGALVADVTAGGPSDHGGLQSGDLVTKVDGKPVHTAAELTRRVALIEPGESVRLQVRRGGHAKTISVTAGLRPSEAQLAQNGGGFSGGGGDEGGAASGSLGMMVAPAPGGGLTVQGVAPGSEAQRKGLKPGDVIEQVSGKPVNDAQDVRSALAAARDAGRKDVLIRARRGGQHLFLALKAGPEQG